MLLPEDILNRVRWYSCKTLQPQVIGIEYDDIVTLYLKRWWWWDKKIVLKFPCLAKTDGFTQSHDSLRLIHQLDNYFHGDGEAVPPTEDPDNTKNKKRSHLTVIK